MTNLHLEPLGNGLQIYVTDSYHFSTDTILLANFSQPTGRRKCADLGTGCGTIPLLWLRENPNLDIAAVEIQNDACALACKSVEFNGVGQNLTIINADLKDLRGRLPFGAFDLVACNPPYKRGGAGIQNPENALTVARHETECTLDDICEAASKLLQFGGRFCIYNGILFLEDEKSTGYLYSIDAQTLEIIPLSRHTGGTYRFSDQSREIWTGNAVIENDTTLTDNNVSVDADHYLLRDENGNPLCNVDFHFSTEMVIQPSVPVYYRIRRASSAIWGWAGHEFAKEVTNTVSTPCI